MIEIQEFNQQVFQSKNIHTLKQMYGDVIQDVANLLSNRMQPQDMDFLKDCLKEMQKYTKLSVELIRYTLLTEKMNSHREAIDFLYTNYGKSLVKKEMGRFYRFLKTNNVTIEPHLGYYKRMLNWSNNLKRYTVSRVIHTFEI